jgi:hypothetical protein
LKPDEKLNLFNVFIDNRGLQSKLDIITSIEDFITHDVDTGLCTVQDKNLCLKRLYELQPFLTVMQETGLNMDALVKLRIKLQGW